MSNTIVAAEDTNNVKSKKVVPDGGWGWVVVCAFSFYVLVLLPMLTNFGLIFKDKIIELQLAATNVAVIQNICSAFGSAIGLLSAPFIKRYGCRPVAFFAAIFFCSGFMLTGMANNFITFLLAYSIITSLGIGFGWSSFFISMTSYFDVHLNKASGMSMTLAAIGPIIYPPIITILLKFYGVDGCIWILSAISLNIFAAALLLQPVQWHMKRVEIKDTEMQLLNTDQLTDSKEIINNSPPTISRQMSIPEDETIDHSSAQSSRKGSRKLSLQHNFTDMNGSQSQIVRMYSANSLDSLHHSRQTDTFNEVNRRGSKRSLSHHLSETKIDEEENEENGEKLSSTVATPTNNTVAIEESNKPKENIFRKSFDWLVNEFDLTLLKDVTFVNTLIGISLADFGEINFMMITPMVLDELNFDIVQVASLMSTIAISDIIFRFLSPFIGDYLRQSPRLMFIHGMIIFLFARLAIIMSTGYGWAMFGCIIMGIGRAIFTVYWNVVVPSCVPIERLPSAMGILMITNGILLMTTGPIVGLLRDQTGNYTSSIHLLNFTTVLAIGFWVIEMIYKRVKAKRKENQRKKSIVK